MIDLHFNTDPAWIETIRDWAVEQEDVVTVWIFGSRVTGVRRPKSNPDPIPDIDVAIQLKGLTIGERSAAGYDLDEADLRARLPVPISIVPYDVEVADGPAHWVAKDGVEIFRRE